MAISNYCGYSHANRPMLTLLGAFPDCLRLYVANLNLAFVTGGDLTILLLHGAYLVNLLGV